MRSPESSGSGCTMTPGFRMPCGSRMRLVSSKRAIRSGAYMRGSSSPRRRPSPCSPDSDPPWATTMSATASATSRMRVTAPGARRSTMGRMCRHPTLACPYQMASPIPVSVSTRRTSPANDARACGGTAGSSMKGMGLPSPSTRSAREMLVRRMRQIDAWSEGSLMTVPPTCRRAAARASPTSPECSTTSIAGARPTMPSSARSAGARLAGSSRSASISSMADGWVSSSAGTASSALVTSA